MGATTEISNHDGHHENDSRDSVDQGVAVHAECNPAFGLAHYTDDEAALLAEVWRVNNASP